MSQYFNDARDFSASSNLTPSVSFFDQLSPSNLLQTPNSEEKSNFDECGEDVAEDLENRETAVLHSCRESRIDLTTMAMSHPTVAAAHSEAELDVAEQTFDDVRSLQRRQSHDGEARRHHQSSESHATSTQETHAATDHESSPTIFNLFATSNVKDPFDIILSEQQKSGNLPSSEIVENRAEHPTSLPTISEPCSTPTSHAGSVFATPNVLTPSGDNAFAYSILTSTPLPSHSPTPSNVTPISHAMAPPMSTPSQNLTPFQSGVPITSPLPSFGVSPVMALPPTILNMHESVSNDDDLLPQEVLRRRDAWIPSPATLRVIDSVR